jgi:hypothetical protein
VVGARSRDRGRRRPPRRLLAIAGFAAAAALAAGVAYAVLGRDAGTAAGQGPDPRAALRIFTTAWVAGDYPTK